MTTPTHSELLPCPLCGSPAAHDYEIDGHGDGWHFAQCQNLMECGMRTDGCASRDVARERWNTRPAQPVTEVLPPMLCTKCGKPYPTNGPYLMPCLCDKPAQPVTVSEDAVKRFISELQKNARAYVKAGEIYIDEADGYTPAFIIDGEWTVGALQDALAAAIGRGGA